MRSHTSHDSWDISALADYVDDDFSQVVRSTASVEKKLRRFFGADLMPGAWVFGGSISSWWFQPQIKK